jgi:TonB family protein
MNFPKHVAISLSVLAMSLSGLASAQTPPDVLQSYKAYNASLQSQDYNSAIKHAKKAWERAEAQLGDHPMTGDLAYNYGYIEKNQGDKAKAIEAFERSIELAALKDSDAAALGLEREVELVSSMDGVSRDDKLEKRINHAIDFANSNGLGRTVFVGELHVHDANICTRRLHAKMQIPQQQLGSLINKASTQGGIKDGNKKCANIAKKAVDIFDANPSDTRPSYVAAANNYVGYGFEANRNWLAAALSYQKSRDAIEDVYGRENPLVARTIGRWMSARNFLKRKDKLEYAESQGLCKCWPFTQKRPTISSMNWVSPDFPAKALRRSSGYAIVQMDVSDAGLPENIRVLNSWPEDIYDKSSLKAAKQLQFPPKTAEEPKDYRKDVTIPYSYYLSLDLEPI